MRSPPAGENQNTVDDGPRDEGPANNRRAGWVLALGSLGAFVVFLDTTIVNIAFQTISHESTPQPGIWHRFSMHTAWCSLRCSSRQAG